MIVYGWPVLWLAAFGTGEVVALLDDQRRLRFLNRSQTYLLVIGLLAVLATVLTGRSWLPRDPLALGALPAAVVGALLAYPILIADDLISRSVFQRQRSRARPSRPSPSAPRGPRVVAVPVGRGGTDSDVRPAGAPIAVARPNDRSAVVVEQACVGILEEMVYRGGLLSFALALSSPVLTVAAVALGSAIFLLNHLQYGSHQILAKIPLLAGCLALTALTGSIVGAVVLHATFNVAIATRIRRRNIPSNGQAG